MIGQRWVFFNKNFIKGGEYFMKSAEKEPRLLINELPYINKSIVENNNGYKGISPCYGIDGSESCLDLDRTGKKLCKNQEGLEYSPRGIECPLQKGVLTLIKKVNNS